MKVVVAGKGGCGKSTVTALLAKELASRGREVLVVDSDESNFGLHSLLGMERGSDFMEYFGGKKVLFEKVKDLRSSWPIDELPEEYVSRKGRIALIAMGKIYDYGEGCSCPINALSSRFLEVVELKEDGFLIADTDAGIEHLGRGIEKGCDLILVVVDPSSESIRLAGKVTEMGESIGKSVYFVLNKVDERSKAIILDSLTASRVVAVIPVDAGVFESGLKGEELEGVQRGIADLAALLEGGG